MSGSAGDMTYDMTAPEIGFGIDSMTVDGEAIGMALNATMKTNNAATALSRTAAAT